MEDLIINYVKPELLILIPILNIIGAIIKKLYIDDRHIPLILCGLSVILCCLWIIGNGAQTLADALFSGVIQGILCAAGSVFNHQVFKQYTKNKD